MSDAKIAGIVLGLLLVLPAAVFAAPPDDLKAYCAGKWPDSYRMQLYCVNEETRSRASVGQWASTDAGIYSRCWNKWDSWRMVAYCGDQERQARSTLGAPAAPVPPPAPPPSPAPATPLAPATSGVNVTPDHDAIDACRMLLKAIDRFLTYQSLIGLRRDVREVVDRAFRSPDAYVRNAASILSAAANSDSVADAAKTFLVTCEHRVVPRAQSDLMNKQAEIEDAARRARAAPPEPQKPSRPISSAEAEQQLKGVLERSDAADAKCRQKQYGAGWVTVCE
jgi:hypothetical protein